MFLQSSVRPAPSRASPVAPPDRSEPAETGRASPGIRPALLIAALGMLGVAGCAQAPQTQQLAAGHGKEYFPSSVYGPASRRVVADGEPIPHGGGQYLVGKPYTVAGQTYYPSERAVRQVGLASWYGDAFHGRLTANGEIYDRDGFTAAHPTMPLPSYARVTNLRNNYTMVVRVNDRGPYHAGRIMDVSRRVAEALDFQRGGTAKIKVEYVGHASLAGSDDAKLYATLRRDGVAGPQERSLIAEAASAAEAAPARVASLIPFLPRSRGEEAPESRRDQLIERRGGEDPRGQRAQARRPTDADGDSEERHGGRDARRERVAERRAGDVSDDRPSPPRRADRRETAEARAAGSGRAGEGDRRRLAAAAVERLPQERGRAGRSARGTDDEGGERRAERNRGGHRDAIAEAAMPPPRPTTHAASRSVDDRHAAEPMPPRRLRVAAADPVRRDAGMRLTRPRGD